MAFWWVSRCCGVVSEEVKVECAGQVLNAASMEKGGLSDVFGRKPGVK